MLSVISKDFPSYLNVEACRNQRAIKGRSFSRRQAGLEKEIQMNSILNRLPWLLRLDKTRVKRILKLLSWSNIHLQVFTSQSVFAVPHYFIREYIFYTLAKFSIFIWRTANVLPRSCNDTFMTACVTCTCICVHMRLSLLLIELASSLQCKLYTLLKRGALSISPRSHNYSQCSSVILLQPNNWSCANNTPSCRLPFFPNPWTCITDWFRRTGGRYNSIVNKATIYPNLD